MHYKKMDMQDLFLQNRTCNYSATRGRNIIINTHTNPRLKSENACVYELLWWGRGGNMAVTYCALRFLSSVPQKTKRTKLKLLKQQTMSQIKRLYYHTDDIDQNETYRYWALAQARENYFNMSAKCRPTVNEAGSRVTRAGVDK